MMASYGRPHHDPVLVDAVLTYLAPRPGAVIVDATCGLGGHSVAILPRLMPDGRLIAIDQDAEAVAETTAHLRGLAEAFVVRQGNFRELPSVLKTLGIARVDGLVADLGMSSAQLDDASRGFSFQSDGPLDMRMDCTRPVTAAALINDRSADELTELFATYGEERFARRIARAIVTERRVHRIASTAELARIILRAQPHHVSRGRIHPATRTFQALRIAVNDELGALETLLRILPDLLAPGGRAVILAFHSLEDRLVKRAFAQGEREGHWARLTKKAVRATDEDVRRNPRSRSVRLRSVERVVG